MRFKLNVSHVCLLVCSSNFLVSVTDGGIETVNKVVVKSGFVIDVSDFARFCIQITSVLHTSNGC